MTTRAFGRGADRTAATTEDASPAHGRSVGKRTLVEPIGQAGPVQRVPGRAPTGAAGDVRDTGARGVTGPGQPLPFADQIQRAFGRHDITGIVAHTDETAQGAAQAIGARAYATGNRVAFAGPPDLHTAAHEAAHVVQQRAGVQLSGGVGDAGDVHERHADAVADAVVAGRDAEPLLDGHAGGAVAGGSAAHAVQRKVDVFSKAHFAKPHEYLRDHRGYTGDVIEEPGSQGILGTPDREFIAKLSPPNRFRQYLENRMNAVTREKTDVQAQVIPGENRPDLQKRLKEIETTLTLLSTVYDAFRNVYDIETAARFYLQHTKTLMDLEMTPKKTHQRGNGDKHSFHKDAGLIKIDPDRLDGDDELKSRKARYLNGPFETGFVRGHGGIENMKHRFIEHVHVDKHDEENGIDIYNTDDEQDGTGAQKHQCDPDLAEKFTGRDQKAIDETGGERNESDIQELVNS